MSSTSGANRSYRLTDSSLFLIAVAFPPFKIAFLLFLCREALVEMDVPTRQSYVRRWFCRMNGRLPVESPIWHAMFFGAVGSSVAGLIMQNLAFSAPLVIGGGMKVTYDLTLSRVFRKLRPPEELKRNAKLLA